MLSSAVLNKKNMIISTFDQFNILCICTRAAAFTQYTYNYVSVCVCVCVCV